MIKSNRRFSVVIYPMSFSEVLQESIDEVNKRAKTDDSLKEVLKNYDGKRVVLNIVGETTFAIAISSEGVSLTALTAPNSEDMYIEIESELAQKIVHQEINPLQILSIILSGKIKTRNISIQEIDLVRRLSRGF